MSFERILRSWIGMNANIAPSQIVNPKGEMKGSAITGPVGKEAAELWPVSSYLFSHPFEMHRTNNWVNSVSHPTLVSSCEEVKIVVSFGVMEMDGLALHCAVPTKYLANIEK